VIIVVLIGAAESKDWMLPKSLGGVESRHEKRSFPMDADIDGEFEAGFVGSYGHSLPLTRSSDASFRYMLQRPRRLIQDKITISEAP
jgi:hypothetical protein